MTTVTATGSSKIVDEVSKATEVTLRDGEDVQKYWKRLVKTADKALSDDEWEALTKPAQDWVNAGQKAINESATFPTPPDWEGGTAVEDEEDEDNDEEAEASDDDDGKADDEDGDEDDSDDDEDSDDEDDDESEEDDDEDAEDDESEDEAETEDEEEDVNATAKRPKKKDKEEAEKPPKAKKERAEKPPKAEKKDAGGGSSRNSKSDKGAADAWRRIVVKNPDASREKHEALFAKKDLKLHKGRMYFIRSEALKTLKILGQGGEAAEE